MKNVLAIMALVLVVAACNLTNKLKTNSNSSSSSGNPTKIGDDPVEKPAPTSAQMAAIANGQDVKWDQQGISWTLPAGWKKQSSTTNTFNYSLGTEVFLIVNISPMPADMPTDLSLNAFHEGAKARAKNGEVDEVKWLELDGVRGAEFRESKPQMGSDLRRLQWLTYRKYAGQTQNLNVMLSGTADNFAKHQDELYAILYSTKLVH
ncbi:MAG: hypothetical protein DMF73_07225 [Acidobacteria bacterium]|nr:MAG: hypothetical protein DMF73_07225 [Acidobacteriota bacterium]